MKCLIFISFIISIVTAVSKSKAPFLWDLNKTPPSEEHKVETCLSDGHGNGSDEASSMEDNRGEKKRRIQVDPVLGRGNEKSLAVVMKISKPDKAAKPNKSSIEQKQKYSLQRKLSYAALHPDEKKAFIQRQIQQEKNRKENMTVEERKAYRDRRNAWGRQNRIRLANTRTKEQKLEYKARRAKANRKYYLARKARGNI